MTAIINENSPLVSIVVPVYNGERYLRETLDSIVAQSYSNVEILLMDDCSTDQTASVVADYKSRINYFRQPRNKGQFANVNDGIAKARGKYIAVYHADDVYNSKIVEREVEFLENHPEAGAVFCFDIFINAEGREYNRLKVPQELQNKDCLDYQTILNGILTYKNRFLPTPGAMVRASVYRELGTFRGNEFQIAADLEMWLRIARRYEIGFLREYLFSYRHGHENSSQIYYRMRTEPERQFSILDEHLSAGSCALAAPAAIRAYEAHRAEDNLMVAVNCYILSKNKEAKIFLDKVKSKRLLASSRIQRMRLLILFVALAVLIRVPRVPLLADAFYRRWHIKSYSA